MKRKEPDQRQEIRKESWRAEEINQSAAKNRDTKVNNEKTHARIKKPLLLMKISANTCTTQRQIAI